MKATWTSAKRAIDLRIHLLSEGIVAAIPGQLMQQGLTHREYQKQAKENLIPTFNPITEHSCQYSATKIFCGGHP